MSSGHLRLCVRGAMIALSCVLQMAAATSAAVTTLGITTAFSDELFVAAVMTPWLTVPALALVCGLTLAAASKPRFNAHSWRSPQWLGVVAILLAAAAVVVLASRAEQSVLAPVVLATRRPVCATAADGLPMDGAGAVLVTMAQVMRPVASQCLVVAHDAAVSCGSTAHVATALGVNATAVTHWLHAGERLFRDPAAATAVADAANATMLAVVHGGRMCWISSASVAGLTDYGGLGTPLVAAQTCALGWPFCQRGYVAATSLTPTGGGGTIVELLVAVQEVRSAVRAALQTMARVVPTLLQAVLIVLERTLAMLLHTVSGGWWGPTSQPATAAATTAAHDVVQGLPAPAGLDPAAGAVTAAAGASAGSRLAVAVVRAIGKAAVRALQKL